MAVFILVVFILAVFILVVFVVPAEVGLPDGHVSSAELRCDARPDVADRVASHG
ncbi:MAG: hypothetical protein ACOH2Q_19205 [Rhodococcus sp. (in: high G+C Gram-positive bacteria)]